jgi:molybdate transport system permease protein
VMAFARSLGEFGATIMVAGNIEGVSRTIPLAIYTDVQTPGGDAGAMRLAIIAIVLSFAALLASEFLARRIIRRTGGGR